MKKVVLLVIAAFAFGFVQAQTSSTEQKDITKILSFKNDTYDFGKIPFGKPVEYDVLITNISHDSVSIDNVKVGCGCTTPKYEKDKKIAPGATVKVTLGFNGATMGVFNKYADIYFNNNTLNRQVTFKGETFTANPAQSTTKQEPVTKTVQQ